VGYRRSLGSVVEAAGIPYGFTLTIWGSAALVAYHRGGPRPGHVALFAAGAVVGFTVVRLFAVEQPVTRWVQARRAASRGEDIMVVEESRPEASSMTPALLAVTHLPALGAAYLGAWLAAHLGAVSWPLAGFVAASAFFAVAAAQLHLFGLFGPDSR
jgi:hypothetical protein